MTYKHHKIIKNFPLIYIYNTYLDINFIDFINLYNKVIRWNKRNNWLDWNVIISINAELDVLSLLKTI